jgi:hypothetical protein
MSDLIPGTRAHVRVDCATLWTDPAAVRSVDAAALADVPEIRAWCAGLTLEQRTTGAGNPVDSQLLAGEEVEIDGVDGEWARIVALEQPSRRDPRGYPGVIRTAHLRPGPGPGAELPPPADTVAATAQGYAGVPYVWGGRSPYGVDCSSLVHLSWRRHGVIIPRDARDQAEATKLLEFGRERPGDLYFFARPGRPISHVGMVIAAPGPDGERRMVHACGTTGRVEIEPVRGERLETLVSVHRVTG